MGRIRQLDDHLASLIAAGEVVAGPASVARELIDNALDAGARSVEVSIEEGGLRLVRVADDGSGMDRDDAVLCLERHATSKLRGADELSRIRTLGFRGEALAAILSVSRMRIETQRADDEVGTQVRAEGGAVVEVRPLARRPGTTVEARELFFNTPARRAYQDSARAEGGRVVGTVQRAAVARPDVRFTLRADGAEVLSLPGTAELLERVRQIHGDEFADSLLPLEGERGGVRVTGYATRPASAARRARRNTFVVNGRPFDSFELKRVLTTGFAGTLPVGHYPEAVIRIDLPETDVDVNVSPDKSTVRFRRPGQVWAAVTDALRHALAQSGAVAPFEEASGAPVYSPPRPAAPPPVPGDLRRPVVAEPRAGWGAEHAHPRAWELMFGQTAANASPEPAEAAAEPVPGPLGAAAPADPPREEAPHGLPRSPAAILQVSNTFLVCAVEGGMLVVDQHSAHERVLYEQLRARYEAQGRVVDVQPLLLPEPLRAQDAAEHALLESMLPHLERLGFEILPAGPREMLVHTVPAALAERAPGRALRALIEAFDAARELGTRSDEVGQSLSPVEDRMLMTLACHAAVKAHQPLSEAEIRRLWSDLVTVELAAHDVHGRPCVVFLPAADLARRMRRTL